MTTVLDCTAVVDVVTPFKLTYEDFMILCLLRADNVVACIHHS